MTTKKCRISAGRIPCKDKDNITIDMVVESISPHFMYRYTLGCMGCDIACNLVFSSPYLLSLASAAKYVGTFCFLCRKLERVRAVQEEVPDGQLSPISDVNKDD